MQNSGAHQAGAGPAWVAESRFYWALFAILVVVFCAFPFRPRENVADNPYLDDTFYNLTISRNIALGRGIVSDGNNRTDGMQPLMVFLQAPLMALAGEDRILAVRIVMAFHIAIHCLALLALALLTTRLIPPLPDWPARMVMGLTLCLASSYAIFRAICMGLETGLYLLLLCLCALHILRMITAPETRLSNYFLLGTLLGFTYLARLDSAFFTLIVGGYFLIREWRSSGAGRAVMRLGAAGLVFFAVTGPWFLYCLSFGHLIPSTGQASLAFAKHIDLNTFLNAIAALTQLVVNQVPLNFMGRERIGPVLGLLALPALAAGAWLVMGKMSGPSRTVLGLLGLHGAVLVCFYTVTASFEFFFFRYFSPLLLLIIPFEVAILCAFVRWRSLRMAGVGAAALINVALLGLMWNLTLGQGNRAYHEQAAWVEKHLAPGVLVGAGQSGTVGYLHDNTKNLDGKINIAAMRAYRAEGIARYVESAGIEYIIDWPPYVYAVLLRDPRVAAKFEKVDHYGNYDIYKRVKP